MTKADPFDHFQRYETVRRIVRQLSTLSADKQHPVRVLEIGANAHFNLRRFLPEAEIVYSDLEQQPGTAREKFVQADASQLPFADGTFDYVVSLDVFEHIPRALREPFISECHRVSSQAAILACPTGTNATANAEDTANQTFRRLAGEGYRWLDEHKQEGLPTHDEISQLISALNCKSARFNHGELQLWTLLMRLHFLKEFAPGLREAVSSFDRFYCNDLYAQDTGPECYRQFWVFGAAAGNLDEQVLFADAQSQIVPLTDSPFEEFVAGVEDQIADSKHALESTRTQLLEQTQRAIEAEARIAVMLSELDDARAHHDKLTAQAEQIKRDFEQSGSWKVTAPLRQVLGHLQTGKSLVGSGQAFIRSRGGLSAAATSLAASVRSEGIRSVAAKVKRLAADNVVTEIPGVANYPEWLNTHDTTIVNDARAFIASQANASEMPLISIVMPTWNPKPAFLEEAIRSASEQIYPNWELCIADDASTDPAIVEIIRRYAEQEPRIRFIARPKNGHIAEATNSGIALARGQWVCFLDHDDVLHPGALALIAQRAGSDGELDIIYTDEDHLSLTGIRCNPFCKPDWSPHLGLSQAYLGHLVAYRKELLDRLNGIRPGTDGAQDYDLWLRASLSARKIAHIPKILYHWRLHEESTALRADSKPYAHDAGQRALEHHVAQKYPEQKLSVVSGDATFTYRLKFQLPETLKASIIIPTRDKIDLLLTCIKTIQEKSSWQNFEILIIDNQSTEQASHDYFTSIQSEDSRVKVIPADMDFNWSRLNNLGAAQASGDILIFLNNDTEVLASDWIEQLAGYASLPDVGTVGGLLLYEDRTIQHSGVIVGMGGWADHVFKGVRPTHRSGPFVSPVLTRNVLAVTGACVAIEKSKFDRLGGFDEAFIICGSDVELGLRAIANDLWNVMCAEARLIHLESKSRTPHVPENDFEQSAIKYEPYRSSQGDPFYNANLSLKHCTPTLKEGADNA